ncbi:hypothetical protein [Marinobacter halodurans]|nr:hypothetical protein [Marinobacter halodurans]
MQYGPSPFSSVVRRSSFFPVMGSLLMALLLAGCGGGDSDTASSAGAARQAPADQAMDGTLMLSARGSDIDLSWSVEGDMTGQNVYRNTRGSADGATLLAELDAEQRTYTDQDVGTGSYWYWIEFEGNAGATATSNVVSNTSLSGSSDGPVGFGAGTTGGQGGIVVTVTTPAELTAAVSDSTPKIIRISGVIDYRNTEGSTTELGCTYSDSYCSVNGKHEKILNVGSYCSGRTLYDITYDTAGKTPLNIGSNKTLIGVGAHSGIKGKGLRMAGGVSNIIIRNLSITDINDGTIWAGDALTINNASNIWIDHNYIARIGRQFIVTGWETAQNVTISGNYLDGTTDYGHYCDQRHYWTALLVAENQSITMIGNRISMTSGRSPKFGKQDSASSAGVLHMVNNYFDQNYGTGFHGDATGTVLMEGNYYEPADGFVPISADSTGIPLYAPLDLSISSTTSTCQSLLGRDCAANYDTNAPSNFVINASAMSAIQANSFWLHAVKSIQPKSYSEVTSQRFGPQADISN